MTDRPNETADDFVDEPGAGADPGEAYRRAVDEGEIQAGEDEEPGPSVGEVYRSGT